VSFARVSFCVECGVLFFFLESHVKKRVTNDGYGSSPTTHARHMVCTVSHDFATAVAQDACVKALCPAMGGLPSTFRDPTTTGIEGPARSFLIGGSCV